jgi:colanic acid biosynthesis glycosyl transferase WcaI
MRVALLSIHYAPELTGIGPYSAELAEALTERGHEVRVITAFPFYPEWRPRIPPGTWLHRSEELNRVQVTRCRIYLPQQSGLLQRLLHELTWTLSALPVVVRYGVWAEAWIVVTPAFGSAVLGACLARLGSVPVHLHVQDLVPDVARESGHMKSGLVFRVAVALAGWVYRSFRSASVLSESMVVGLRRYARGERPRVAVAPNWPRRLRGSDGSLPAALRGRVYAVYAGSSGRKQDLTILAQAADLLATRQGPAIAVLGAGPGHASVRVADGRLVWLGLVDDATYGAVIAGALAGIVSLVPGVGNSVVPSKLTNYLAAGRPAIVIADPGSEAVRVVEEAGCGFAVQPGRPDLLAQVLCRLASNPAEGAALGARGRAYAAERWDKDRTVDLLEGALGGADVLPGVSSEGLSRPPDERK